LIDQSNLLINVLPSLHPVSVGYGYILAQLPPQQWLINTLDGLQAHGWATGIIFIVLYILCTLAGLPGSVLTLGAGAIFGLLWGTIYVFIGATLGAIAALLLSRYLLRSWIRKRIAQHPSFIAFDQTLATAGLKLVILTRLSPLFPFNLLNYAFGLTGVSLRDYTLGSIGMLPGTLLYVYLGSLTSDLARLGTVQQPPALQWGFRLIGLAATVIVTVYITKLARQALDEVVTKQDLSDTNPSNEG
jgi:uncharacterized membrane protein YdjX (TVP38/TMEM64 family)